MGLFLTGSCVTLQKGCGAGALLCFRISATMPPDRAVGDALFVDLKTRETRAKRSDSETDLRTSVKPLAKPGGTIFLHVCFCLLPPFRCNGGV